MLVACDPSPYPGYPGLSSATGSLTCPRQRVYSEVAPSAHLPVQAPLRKERLLLEASQPGEAEAIDL